MFKSKVTKPIIIVNGEPNSIFSEILVKSFKSYKNKKPIILIGSYDLIVQQLKKLKLNVSLNLINYEKDKFDNLIINKINIINIKYNFKKPFERISSKSNHYIKRCFNKAFDLIKKNKISGLINGPISKKYFLKSKYPGITEYLSEAFKIQNRHSMLIYNENLSISPIITHLPISRVSKKLNKNDIVVKSLLISNFFNKILSRKPKIAITGLNPHCENFLGASEENKIITPAIKNLRKKKINVRGPFPADTIFLKKNIKKFDVIIGMYHDQVLSPIKAIYGFDAINITLGLPFLRVSPDHGPNTEMIGKNKSDPKSLIKAIRFLDKNK